MTGKQDWETPWDLFYLLDAEFRFTIDGAARADNAKCPRFITPEMDAHKINLHGEIIFCNPPYANMEPWVSTFLRWQEDNIVIFLVQDKTDTAWFQQMFNNSLECRFLRGGVNFIGSTSTNMHGAVVFIQDGNHAPASCVRIWDWRKELTL